MVEDGASIAKCNEMRLKVTIVEQTNLSKRVHTSTLVHQVSTSNPGISRYVFLASRFESSLDTTRCRCSACCMCVSDVHDVHDLHVYYRVTLLKCE